MIEARLGFDFFNRDVLDVAPELVGKMLVRKLDNNTVHRSVITEVEAYRGVEDLACHASKGRTPRTDVMFQRGGLVYVYLIYGMYWMLNFVTGEPDNPQAVLIRGIDNIIGSGRVGRELQIDKSFYAEDLSLSERIYILDAPVVQRFETAPRVGIDYAGDEWKNKPWRFIMSR